MITIRYTVLLLFILSLIAAGYLGFSSIKLTHDKLIHFATFAILTAEFFFIFHTRSVKQLSYITFVVCSICGGIGSEFLQHLINSHRVFDPIDILCNLIGSVLGLSISVTYQSYHKGVKPSQSVEIELS